MKSGDLYKHYKGGIYYFNCIALPLKEKSNVKKSVRAIQPARYHENTHDIDLYIDDNGTVFINSDIPHVIYQSEKDINSNDLFAREVDIFFDTVTIYSDRVVKRFTLNY